ncbi:hypothetical protein [Streptomyces sp. NBC_01217]|uniref:hypothetical protein n=1 Tax=Streptomyces sp. NBC_01217 TaxID=2903779 RepID=UPI002E0F80BA|nr:hypothetical protein OG507_20760 [Streptomyces sp. NBC_01217]
MFDHIRRTAAWARGRLVPASGRQGRSLSASPPPMKPKALPVPKPQQPAQRSDSTREEHSTLVRPYMLTVEERARRWSEPQPRTLLVCPHIDITKAA